MSHFKPTTQGRRMAGSVTVLGGDDPAKPYRCLWSAVLLEAVEAYQRAVIVGKRPRAELHRFFFDGRLRSFSVICSILDLEPQRVRAALLDVDHILDMHELKQLRTKKKNPNRRNEDEEDEQCPPSQ